MLPGKLSPRTSIDEGYPAAPVSVFAGDTACHLE